MAESRLRSFQAALSGLASMLRGEPNARIHFAVALAVILAGFWLEISRLEWCWLVAAIAAVLAAEALNTALESLADATHPDPHPGVGRAKDAAALESSAASMRPSAVGRVASALENARSVISARSRYSSCEVSE